MLYTREGTYVVRAKRPNVEAFGVATAESVNIGRFGPNLKCSFPNIQLPFHEHNEGKGQGKREGQIGKGGGEGDGTFLA
ncbi:hypothetical protein H5410_015493 [Solanum commersonii]|uniref:Uncharacterized protein n=1 Tax=Solanum commersonii TaxID=4109 RepID=A0A9J5ZTN3_SOLCO|nr:hypothetical protein H5410_015493 [Solanum commersonii]